MDNHTVPNGFPDSEPLLPPPKIASEDEDPDEDYNPVALGGNDEEYFANGGLDGFLESPPFLHNSDPYSQQGSNSSFLDQGKKFCCLHVTRYLYEGLSLSRKRKICVFFKTIEALPLKDPLLPALHRGRRAEPAN